MNAPIVIVNYDPAWPAQFQLLRSRIAPCLDGLFATIEHVGSTAVIGLAAKPIIDIDVLLLSPRYLASAIAKLHTLGYRHQGDLGISGREAFQAPRDDSAHHLYVCPPSSPAYLNHIAFRDYLRSHEDAKQDYAQLKRELAARFGEDRDAYTKAKSMFIERTLDRAREESRRERDFFKNC